jgi:hypothetical protein
MRALIRLSAYLWALPTSMIGLAVMTGALLSGGRAHWVSGVIEVHGGFAAFALRRLVPLRGGARAITLGHVVLGLDAAVLDATRRHERVHVRQAERWGPLFVPAYLLASLLIWLRGGNGYLDNPFEREAYKIDRTR